MYKVILVDDEFLMRDSISRNTKWNECGFELCGTAENGKEAIELLEKELPDLILTDICMPVMDGLGLSAYVHENHPEMKVIIISGYDDFEYAKRALKYEVADYILKPITSFELAEELLKIRKKLDDSKEKRIQVEKIQREYEKNIPMLRSHFLERLLDGSYVKNDVDAQLEHFHVEITGNYQCAVMFDLEDDSQFRSKYPKSNDELVDFAIGNIAGEIVESESDVLFLQTSEEKTICIFMGNNADTLYQRVEEVAGKIIQAIYHFMKIKVCVLIGDIVSGVGKWGESYAGIIRAGEGKFLLEEHEFVYGRDFAPAKDHGHIQTAGWTEKLVLMIKLNQLEELRAAIREMFLEFRASECERKTILLHVQNLILTILINLEDNIDSAEVENKDVEFVHRLSEMKHLSEVEEKFASFCKELSDAIAGQRESVNQKQAVLALDYIEKNYMNVNMSLNMVCAHLCMSTSYFSTIFKNATGETFIEALTRVRMEKAKKLLESTSMKSYEVALSVGYNDPHYFSSTFKKHMGMTPTEYSKQLRK